MQWRRLRCHLHVVRNAQGTHPPGTVSRSCGRLGAIPGTIVLVNVPFTLQASILFWRLRGFQISGA